MVLFNYGRCSFLVKTTINLFVYNSRDFSTIIDMIKLVEAYMVTSVQANKAIMIKPKRRINQCNISGWWWTISALSTAIYWKTHVFAILSHRSRVVWQKSGVKELQFWLHTKFKTIAILLQVEAILFPCIIWTFQLLGFNQVCPTAV